MFLINVDVSQLAALVDADKAVKAMADEIGQDVAGMVHAKAVELAGQKLHSRRQQFIQGLKPPVKVDDAWVVALDAKVRWIDDGQDEYSMLKTLLGPQAKNVHTDSKGNRYVVVPFDKSPGKGPASTSESQQDLIGAVKTELKKRGIPFGKLEKGADGQPKIGLLHKFSIPGQPLKTKQGPGQGHGPVGQVRQGNTGIPFLQNVQVYQHPGKGEGKAKRTILTFRIASEKHRDQGKWEHPGNAPTNIIEEALNWAVDTWEKDVAPAVLQKVVDEL